MSRRLLLETYATDRVMSRVEDVVVKTWDFLTFCVNEVKQAAGLINQQRQVLKMFLVPSAIVVKFVRHVDVVIVKLISIREIFRCAVQQSPCYNPGLENKYQDHTT